METPTNLKDLERKAFGSYLSDGLLDMFLGALALLMAFGSWNATSGTESAWMRFLGYGMIAAACILYIAAKRWVVVPRLGIVKFGTARKRKQKTMLWTLGIVVNLTFLLSLISGWTGWVKVPLSIPAPTLVLAILIFSIFLLLSYFLGLTRIAFFGFFLAIADPTGWWIKNRTGSSLGFLLAFGIPGIAMLIAGLILFVRFLKKNPLIQEKGTVS